MPRRWIAILLATMSVLSAASCEYDPAADPPTTIEPPAGTYTHEGLGLEFPERVGEFERLEVTTYNDEETDIGVGYRSAPMLIEATVFVYPSREETPVGSPPDQQHFERVKAEIEAARPGSMLVRANDDAMLANALGKRASYQLETVFAGANRRLISDVYLFGIDDWYIKYRFTYPAEGGEASSAAIRQFMESLGLPRQ